MNTQKLFSSACYTLFFGITLVLMTIDAPASALHWVGSGSLVTKPGHCMTEGQSCSTLGQVLPCGYPQGQTSCAFYSNNCTCMY